jgi:hypothetical protein
MRWTRRCRVRMRSQGEAIRERSTKACGTSGVVADGEIGWSWHPLLVSSPRGGTLSPTGMWDAMQSVGDGGQRNSAPGRSRISRKTTAQGRPDVSGASAVNTRAHTHYPQRARGCGCIGHPAFPAPSRFSRADSLWKTLGRVTPRSLEACLQLRGTVPHTQLSLSATGSRECAPDDRLQRTIQYTRDSRDEIDRPRRTGCPA